VVLDAPIRQPCLQYCAERLIGRQCPAEREGAAIDRKRLVSDGGLTRHRAVALLVDLHDDAATEHLLRERRIRLRPPTEHRLVPEEHVLIELWRRVGDGCRRGDDRATSAVAGEFGRGVGNLENALTLDRSGRHNGSPGLGNLVEQQKVGTVAND